MHKLITRLVIAILGYIPLVPVLAQSTAIVGDAYLSFPAVKGWEIVAPSSPSYMEGERWTAPSNRLLAVYEALDQGKDNSLRQQRKMAVQSYRKAEHVNVSLSAFQSLRNQFQINNKSLIDIAKKNADMHHPPGIKGVPERDIKVGDVQVIEMFNDKSDWSISLLAIVTYRMEENGSSHEVPLIMSTSVLLLKGKILFLYVYSALDAPNSRKWVKSQTAAWLSEAYNKN